MIPMLTAKKNPLDPVKLREHVLTWFDKVLRAKYKAPASFKVVFNQSRKEPLDLDHQWGNEKIFAIEKRPGDPRLPPPPLCALQIKIHACDAKYGFSRRNADFCKLVNDANCAGAAVGKGGARKGSAPKGKGK